MPSPLRRLLLATLSVATAAFAQTAPTPTPNSSDPATTLAAIFSEALARGQAFENLRSLVHNSPGRLSGSKSLERAVVSTGKMLTALGLDRVYKQDVRVPHWERGSSESVIMTRQNSTTRLNAVALGGSVPSPSTGTTAEVIELKSLDELATLGRNRGPGLAATYGAVAVLTRSLTLAQDDIPHTGNTTYAPNQPKIPAAALSTVAADKLSATLTTEPKLRVTIKINSRWLPDAPSHNVIGEIRGAEFPDKIILVGGHLDSWDITPGAHDNGSGCVQSIEVLRLFRALHLKPRHTLRCVLFTNEENGTRGSIAYAAAAKAKQERHLFAVESDNGGFQPRGFNLGSTRGPVHERAAAQWRTLFEPYGISSFVKGTGGADVTPLLAQGATVAGLTPDSQRYFDYHHTTTDTLDKVNPRELHLGAAALASLIWLVDTQGL